MSQITYGIRSILNQPIVYNTFLHFLGVTRFYRKLAKNIIQANEKDLILEIGCGTAMILNYLPVQTRYYGFDQSLLYINYARKRFKKIKEANFFNSFLNSTNLINLPKFNISLCLGFLHHLSDEEVLNCLKLNYDALVSGGRLITYDPAIINNQNFIARFMVTNDRGQNVRTLNEYKALASKVFEKVDANIYTKFNVPYTSCYMVCIK